MRCSTLRRQFQYLKGAIEGWLADRVVDERRQFQYLKGAIEGSAGTASRPAEFDFNTSKVRLKVFSALQFLFAALISIPQRCD